MKKLVILLLLFVFSSSLLAEAINEYKSDIHFANGVGATSRFASFNEGITQVKKYKDATPNITKFIGDYYLAFNTGHGVIPDFFEAWLQYQEEHLGVKISWDIFKTALGKKLHIAAGAENISEEVVKKYEAQDLDEQVKNYKNSILAGHEVIVLAHSQGDFFTKNAYVRLDEGQDSWMQKYFVKDR